MEEATCNQKMRVGTAYNFSWRLAFRTPVLLCPLKALVRVALRISRGPIVGSLVASGNALASRASGIRRACKCSTRVYVWGLALSVYA